MKRYLAVAAVLLVLFGLPFREFDTARLLPVTVLQAEKTSSGVHIITDVGEGNGLSWAEAVEDLRKNAAGEVFFETAEQLVFCDRELRREAVESGLFRPAARIRFAEKPMEVENLNQYLSAHEAGLTVAEWLAHYA